MPHFVACITSTESGLAGLTNYPSLCASVVSCPADALDGNTNGADGPGKPDGQAAPSGTNAGAVNPPPGSNGRRLRQFPVQPDAIPTTVSDAQAVEDQANADIADVAADDALGRLGSTGCYRTQFRRQNCSSNITPHCCSVLCITLTGM